MKRIMKSLKNLFKPEDFDGTGHCSKSCAEIANEILGKFIEENGVKLHGFHHKNGPTGAWTTSIIEATHTGILLDIQPLKQCEHKEAIYVENKNRESWFECEDCGKPVKAKGWEGL